MKCGNPPAGTFSFWFWPPPRAERCVGWTGLRPCTCMEPPPFLWAAAAAAASGAVWTACSTMGTLLWGMPWSPDGCARVRKKVEELLLINKNKSFYFYQSLVLHCTAGWAGRKQPAGCRCASCLCRGSNVGGTQQRMTCRVMIDR